MKKPKLKGKGSLAKLIEEKIANKKPKHLDKRAKKEFDLEMTYEELLDYAKMLGCTVKKDIDIKELVKLIQDAGG